MATRKAPRHRKLHRDFGELPEYGAESIFQVVLMLSPQNQRALR
jgi:hypothetical protein